MYMRLVQAKYQPAALSIIRKIYDEKIIPQLQKMKGCLFACLIKSENDPDEGISLTLWDSQENAESYVKSGAFQALLDEIKPFFSDSSEWKIQLGKDMKVEYQAVQEEPIIKSYNTVMASKQETPSEGRQYLRILSLNIQSGKMEQFRKIYKEEISPELKKVHGCRYAYLTTGSENQNEAISITIWEDRKDAENYEKEMFHNLLTKAKHTLSDLYQWKMALEQEKKWQVMTSDDVSVKYYSVVSGKGFK